MNLTLGGVITNFVSTIMGPLLVAMVGWAVIVFFWSLFEYLQGDAAKKGNALSRISWGILVLFVMISLWGLVSILTNTFTGWGGGGNQVQVPYFQGQ
ncbi:MAG: hypothetical protein WCW56_02300 [Candidatus Paceibacterota bacterium]|jgi:hypothetical protein